MAGQGISFLRFPQVIERTGLSRSSILRKVENGTFPAPSRPSERIIAWSSSSIDTWIEDCIAEASEKQEA